MRANDLLGELLRQQNKVAKMEDEVYLLYKKHFATYFPYFSPADEVYVGLDKDGTLRLIVESTDGCNDLAVFSLTARELDMTIEQLLAHKEEQHRLREAEKKRERLKKQQEQEEQEWKLYLRLKERYG